MAYVLTLKPLEPLAGGRPHSESSATWRLAERDGSRVLQIDTYGSASRQDVGTISQSIQLDEERAAELVAICRSVFPAIS